MGIRALLHSALHGCYSCLEGSIGQCRSPMSQLGEERCGEVADVVGWSSRVGRQGACNRGRHHHRGVQWAWHSSCWAVASKATPIGDLRAHSHVSGHRQSQWNLEDVCLELQERQASIHSVGEGGSMTGRRQQAELLSTNSGCDAVLFT